jgi:hypothetical protein
MASPFSGEVSQVGGKQFPTNFLAVNGKMVSKCGDHRRGEDFEAVTGAESGGTHKDYAQSLREEVQVTDLRSSSIRWGKHDGRIWSALEDHGCQTGLRGVRGYPSAGLQDYERRC